MHWMSIYLFLLLVVGLALTFMALATLRDVVRDGEWMSLMPTLVFGIPGILILIAVNIMWGM